MFKRTKINTAMVLAFGGALLAPVVALAQQTPQAPQPQPAAEAQTITITGSAGQHAGRVRELGNDGQHRR
jgi:hypothetical protein